MNSCIVMSVSELMTRRGGLIGPRFEQPAPMRATQTQTTNQQRPTRIARTPPIPFGIVAAALWVVQGNSTSIAINRAACLFWTTLSLRARARCTSRLRDGSGAGRASEDHIVVREHQ